MDQAYSLEVNPASCGYIAKTRNLNYTNEDFVRIL